MRILMVEDDTLFGSAIQKSLLRAGYAVDWVRDGRTALEALVGGEHAAVVLDLGLPAMSGLDVVRRAFPETLLIAREPVDWGATDDVLTPENMLKARNMIEAFDRQAHHCSRAAA